jgi:hypothetical protein
MRSSKPRNASSRSSSAIPRRGQPPRPRPVSLPSAPDAPATTESDIAPAAAANAASNAAGPDSVRRRATPRQRAGTPLRGAFFDVEMLPAGHGDALWIEYGDGKDCCRWLVDCGTQQTAAHLMKRVEQVPERERELQLFVMSHIDSDHIGGALPFLRPSRACAFATFGSTVGVIYPASWGRDKGRCFRPRSRISICPGTNSEGARRSSSATGHSPCVHCPAA